LQNRTEQVSFKIGFEGGVGVDISKMRREGFTNGNISNKWKNAERVPLYLDNLEQVNTARLSRLLEAFLASSTPQS